MLRYEDKLPSLLLLWARLSGDKDYTSRTCAIHYFHKKLPELTHIQKNIFKIKVGITVPLSVSCKKPLFGCIPMNHDVFSCDYPGNQVVEFYKVMYLSGLSCHS